MATADKWAQKNVAVAVPQQTLEVAFPELEHLDRGIPAQKVGDHMGGAGGVIAAGDW